MESTIKFRVQVTCWSTEKTRKGLIFVFNSLKSSWMIMLMSYFISRGQTDQYGDSDVRRFIGLQKVRHDWATRQEI